MVVEVDWFIHSAWLVVVEVDRVIHCAWYVVVEMDRAMHSAWFVVVEVDRVIHSAWYVVMKMVGVIHRAWFVVVERVRVSIQFRMCDTFAYCSSSRAASVYLLSSISFPGTIQTGVNASLLSQFKKRIPLQQLTALPFSLEFRQEGYLPSYLPGLGQAGPAGRGAVGSGRLHRGRAASCCS